MERSVRDLSERAAGARRDLRLRRAATASRGPLNADVRPSSMGAVATGIRMLGRSMACGLWAVLVPLAIFALWLFAEFNWLEQPPDGSDSHLRGAVGVLASFPLLWLLSTAWFVILALARQFQFRRAFILTMLPALSLPALLAYVTAMAGAPTFVIVAGASVALAVEIVSTGLAAWKWSKLNATWPN